MRNRSTPWFPRHSRPLPLQVLFQLAENKVVERAIDCLGVQRCHGAGLDDCRPDHPRTRLQLKHTYPRIEVGPIIPEALNFEVASCTRLGDNEPATYESFVRDSWVRRGYSAVRPELMTFLSLQRREIIWQVSCACQVFFGLFFAWKVSFSEGKSRWMRETNKLGAWEEGAKHRERKSFNIPFRPFPHESVPSRVVIIYPVNK